MKSVLYAVALLMLLAFASSTPGCPCSPEPACTISEP
jgi:hypothetical protein